VENEEGTKACYLTRTFIWSSVHFCIKFGVLLPCIWIFESFFWLIYAYHLSYVWSCVSRTYLCWVFGSLEWWLVWLEDLGRVGRAKVTFTGAPAAFGLIFCPIYYILVTFRMGGTHGSFASPFDDGVYLENTFRWKSLLKSVFHLPWFFEWRTSESCNSFQLDAIYKVIRCLNV